VQDIFFGEHRDVENKGDNKKLQAKPSTSAIASPVSLSGTSVSSSTVFTAQDVAQAAAKRSVAKLTVYVVSSNPEHEQGIEFIFSKIPVRLIRLQATDFYTMSEGLYPGMGVDRVATLKAAAAHYGYPALVLDGGTAMTYTAADCQ
jgi:pantothenate kinase type III